MGGKADPSKRLTRARKLPDLPLPNSQIVGLNRSNLSGATTGNEPQRVLENSAQTHYVDVLRSLGLILKTCHENSDLITR